MMIPNRQQVYSGKVIVILVTYFVLTLNAAAIRLKDVAAVEGVRDNQLLGYGLVIGLNGTGDGSSNEMTVRSVLAMLRRNGITVDPKDIKSKNVASVLVTATLPPFSRAGSRIDVLISSLGDAANLQGGTLLLTPLKAPNGQVFAVAQGAISTGGFGVGAGGNKVQKNHPTVAAIPNGAIVEREVELDFTQRTNFRILLNNPDFTTAARVARAINAELNAALARPLDSGTVSVNVPADWQSRVVEFLALVEGVPVFPDQKARIILDERTGTVIMGEDVRISTVAISHGDLTFQISQFNQVSQPAPLAPESAQTVVQQNQSIEVQETEVNLSVLEESVSLSEVVGGLNALGVSARDLIAILQALKAAGALQATIEIR